MMKMKSKGVVVELLARLGILSQQSNLVKFHSISFQWPNAKNQPPAAAGRLHFFVRLFFNMFLLFKSINMELYTALTNPLHNDQLQHFHSHIYNKH